jgi:hypothetical protein
MVMVRGDGPVVVRLDQETLDEERSVIAEVERRMREWDRGFVELWNQLIEKQEAWR